MEDLFTALREGRIYLSGPIERIDGKLSMCIPLEEGGEVLAEYTKGISRIQDGQLIISPPENMLAGMGIFEGTEIEITIKDGRFTFYGPPPKGNA